MYRAERPLLWHRAYGVGDLDRLLYISPEFGWAKRYVPLFFLVAFVIKTGGSTRPRLVVEVCTGRLQPRLAAAPRLWAGAAANISKNTATAVATAVRFQAQS